LIPGVGDAAVALRALGEAMRLADANRATAIDEWLGQWVTREARQRCFVTLRGVAYRKAHSTTARPIVDGSTWRKLLALANEVGVSPQRTLEGLVDLVMSDPAYRAAAKRFIQTRWHIRAHPPVRRHK
jgi:hypothetical protein